MTTTTTKNVLDVFKNKNVKVIHRDGPSPDDPEGKPQIKTFWAKMMDFDELMVQFKLEDGNMIAVNRADVIKIIQK